MGVLGLKGAALSSVRDPDEIVEPTTGRGKLSKDAN